MAHIVYLHKNLKGYSRKNMKINIAFMLSVFLTFEGWFFPVTAVLVSADEITDNRSIRTFDEEDCALAQRKPQTFVSESSADRAALGVPGNPEWSDGALATALWNAVDGADYYDVKIRVYDGNNLLGESRTGTADTKIDLQQEIRSLSVSDGLNKVDAEFSVAARNTQTEDQSDFSSWSQRISYALNALDIAAVPTDLVLSENGILSFKEADNAVRYEVRFYRADVTGSISTHIILTDESNSWINNGRIYTNLNDGLKKYCIENGYLNSEIYVAAFARSVTADGQYSESSMDSNRIVYLVEGNVKAPVMREIKKEGGRYYLYFDVMKEAVKYDIAVDSDLWHEEQYDTSDTRMFDNMTVSDNGTICVEITRMLRYYIGDIVRYNEIESANVRVRVRAETKDEVGVFGTALEIKDCKSTCYYEALTNVMLDVERNRDFDGTGKNPLKCVLSFDEMQGVASYNVIVGFFRRGMGWSSSTDFNRKATEKKDGRVSIDITSDVQGLYETADLSGTVSLVRARVRAIGTNEYEYGELSEYTSPCRYYPYDRNLIENIYLSPTDPIVAVGNSIYMGKTVYPDDGFYQILDWSSGDESVLKINNEGKIEGVRPGNSLVTVTVDGIIKSSVSANVYEVSARAENENDKKAIIESTGCIIDDIGNNDMPDLSRTDISANELSIVKTDIRNGVSRGDNFYSELENEELDQNDFSDKLDLIMGAIGIDVKAVSGNAVSNNAVSNNAVSNNSVSNNSVSNNSVSNNSVSGNGISGNKVSDNDVTGNTISSNGKSENSAGENDDIRNASESAGWGILAGFNVIVEMFHLDSYGTKHHIGNITEFDKSLSLCLNTTESVIPAETIEGREYYLVRLHEGVAESIPFEIESDRCIRAKSDRFSDFVLLYADDYVREKKGGSSSSSSSSVKPEESSSGAKPADNSSSAITETGSSSSSSSSVKPEESSSSAKPANNSSSAITETGSSSSSSSSVKPVWSSSSRGIITTEKTTNYLTEEEIEIRIPEIDPELIHVKGKAGTYMVVANPVTGQKVGIVRTVRKGTIKLYVLDGKKKKTVCVIKIEQPKLKPRIKLKAGKERQLKLSGTKLSAKWSSSDESIVSITTSGMARAVNAGTATVTAEIGNHIFTTTVSVK